MTRTVTFGRLRRLINTEYRRQRSDQALGWSFIVLAVLYGMGTKYSEGYSVLHGFIFEESSLTCMNRVKFRCLRALINTDLVGCSRNEAVGWGFIVLSMPNGTRATCSRDYSGL